MGLFCEKNIKVRVLGFIKLVSLGGAGYGSWQFKNGSEQPRNFNGWKSDEKILDSSIGYLVSNRMGLRFTQVGWVVAVGNVVVTIYYQKEAP